MVGLPGSWHPSRASRRGAAWAHRGGFHTEPVRVVDLSVSGAGVLAVPTLALHPGAVMCLRFEGGKGHVQIRHIAESVFGDDENEAETELYYGVTFMRLDERLRSVVHSLVVGRRRNFQSSRPSTQQAASG
jgi:c-di-GMP-binding flagellar brake protein YcgR